MIFLFLLLALIFPPNTQAIAADIFGTVKINVCGDGVVEQPAEDCEGNDLNGGSCSSLGYASGTLGCDIACSYDTSLCVAPTPTPTPSSTATPSTTSSSNPSGSTTITQFLTPTPSKSPLVPIITNFVTTLPASIQELLIASGLSINSNLTLNNLERIIGTWVLGWKSTTLTSLTGRNIDVALLESTIYNENNTVARCDINKDSSCNLTDLSVILFYFNR